MIPATNIALFVRSRPELADRGSAITRGHSVWLNTLIVRREPGIAAERFLVTPHMSGTLMAGFPGSERPRQNVPPCGLIAGLRKQAEPITQRSLLCFGRCDVSVTDSR